LRERRQELVLRVLAEADIAADGVGDAEQHEWKRAEDDFLCPARLLVDQTHDVSGTGRDGCGHRFGGFDANIFILVPPGIRAPSHKRGRERPHGPSRSASPRSTAAEDNSSI
jgi:hypothetical protein